jgi:ferritin
MAEGFKLPVRNSENNTTNTTKKSKLISEKCIEKLNYRIEQEEYSSRVYLAMSMWLENKGFEGAAKTWAKYASEENNHADWARKYLLSLGITPCTPALKQPKEEFTGLPEIIKLSYQHEFDITNQCKELANCALMEGDHMLYQLGLKYLAEQVEEMDKVQTLVDQLEAFGEDKIAMRLFDHELKG